MHPLLARPWPLLLVGASAALAGVPLAWLLRVLDPRPWGAALAFALPMQVFYSFIALSAWWVCRRHPMRGDAAGAGVAAPLGAPPPAAPGARRGRRGGGPGPTRRRAPGGGGVGGTRRVLGGRDRTLARPGPVARGELPRPRRAVRGEHPALLSERDRPLPVPRVRGFARGGAAHPRDAGHGARGRAPGIAGAVEPAFPVQQLELDQRPGRGGSRGRAPDVRGARRLPAPHARAGRARRPRRARAAAATR